MYKPLDQKPDFPKLEEEVLAFWEQNGVFEQSLRKNQGKKNFVFFEGPPTANGQPGLHHVEARSFKDAILRFQTMRGNFVLRRAGWDTHGLPVEIEVEKSLKISGKKEIENLVPGNRQASIEKFNELCRQNVWKYKEEWEQFTKRMGFWIDLNNPYVTYDNHYIESVWWIIKNLSEKKVKGQPLLYQGHKVLPFCPRCGTALSSHEVAQGYQSIEENSVYLKFLLREKKLEVRKQKNEQEVIKLDRPTYVLSWTTTPWTLPGNVALAVGEKIDYVIAICGKVNYIVAAELAEALLPKPYTILEKFKGKHLAGASYQPLFDVAKLKSKNSYKIYPADFVTTQEGTGIVHTAVMYGEDDYELGTKVGLPKVHTVTEEGRFIDSLPGLKGRLVKDKDTETYILQQLRKHGFLFAEKPYRHDYPFCWRCTTPLIYYARNSWFIRMSALRERLQKNNQQINWVPDYIKDGRFGGWLREVKDWAISRDRYWGTPLPFWRCEQCKECMCIGSMKELAEKVETISKPKIQNSKFDLHRPFIDEVILKCDKCGGPAKRIPEVLDVWLDSGAMPFAQWHYPFENKEKIDSSSPARTAKPGSASERKHRDPSTPLRSAQDDSSLREGRSQFPADFITEAIDQTRGWFYTLLAVATALGYDYPAFQNVICLGHVLDSHGVKMSKSKGNMVAPADLAKKYGIDAVRWYMYSVNQPGEPKLFSEIELVPIMRRVQLVLWNIANYFITYANANKWVFQAPAAPSDNILDRWITALTQVTVNDMTEHLSKYDVFRAARAYERFIDDFSTWYLRRSRARVGSEFFSTLFHALYNALRLLAPFMPFTAEAVYKVLRPQNWPESVHLAEWPEAVALSAADKTLLEQMVKVRGVVEQVLAWRKQKNLKVRQPLSELVLIGKNSDWENYTYLLAEELNVIAAKLASSPPAGSGFEEIQARTPTLRLFINAELTPELLIKGLARELERLVQGLRKEAGLKVGELVEMFYQTTSEEVYESFEFFDSGKTYVTRVIGSKESVDFGKDMRIGQHRVWIGFRRPKT
ncbi:MAG: isoleucine--tRNA ligase [Candidatus Doudnabacteria bacterium]|nr:isoleucine--tRNA ligase [Candidatus Doudnabacteria bacterium]